MNSSTFKLYWLRILAKIKFFNEKLSNLEYIGITNVDITEFCRMRNYYKKMITRYENQQLALLSSHIKQIQRGDIR